MSSKNEENKEDQKNIPSLSRNGSGPSLAPHAQNMKGKSFQELIKQKKVGLNIESLQAENLGNLTN